MSSHPVHPQTKMNVKKLLLLIWLVHGTFKKYFIPILNYFSSPAKRKYSIQLHIPVSQGDSTKITDLIFLSWFVTYVGAGEDFLEQ